MIITKKVRTIIILAIVIALSFYSVAAIKAVQYRKEAAFQARQELWKQPNPAVEEEIKGYIDNVDWAYYVNEFFDAVMNPGVTLSDFYRYYGITE